MPIEYISVLNINMFLGLARAIYPIVYIRSIGRDGIHVTDAILSHLLFVYVSKGV